MSGNCQAHGMKESPVMCKAQFKSQFHYNGCEKKSLLLGGSANEVCFAEQSLFSSRKVSITSVCRKNEFFSMEYTLCLPLPGGWKSLPSKFMITNESCLF